MSRHFPGIADVTAPIFGNVPEYDGGGTDAPHDVLAEVPMVNAKVPPEVIAEVGTNAAFHDAPFQMALWMYGALSAAFGALIVSVLPLGSVTIACVNSGLPNARSAVPGVSG